MEGGAGGGGGGGQGEGLATALRTQKPERAASADPGAGSVLVCNVSVLAARTGIHLTKFLAHKLTRWLWWQYEWPRMNCFEHKNETVITGVNTARSVFE